MFVRMWDLQIAILSVIERKITLYLCHFSSDEEFDEEDEEEEEEEEKAEKRKGKGGGGEKELLIISLRCMKYEEDTTWPSLIKICE